MKKYYSRFLEALGDKLHFVAHSHHLWPDVTRDAVIECWEDACNLTDDKWDKFFEEVIPKAQKHISTILNFSRPSDISFATNTHELVFKLISTQFEKSNVRVLTTNCEFNSFDRQIKKLSEWEKFSIDKVDVEQSTESFVENFIREIKKNDYDFIYFSHVFFNKGFALTDEQIDRIIKSIEDPETIICIDGYHAFSAIPTDISKWEDRIFYTGGGYKYAQAGEGVCFLTLPKNCKLRPMSTGWFAGFDDLENEQSNKVGFSNDGMRFWGSTIEPTGYYRFNSVWDLFKKENITVEKTHQTVQKRQGEYLELLEKHDGLLKNSTLLFNAFESHAHFFIHEFPNELKAQEAFLELKKKGILSDLRANRVRLGFASYLEKSDINELFSRIST